MGMNKEEYRNNQDSTSINHFYEKAYYVEKYSDHVDGQNEKNRKARYYDRVKTIDGILENNKMCPEETLLQLENIDGTVLADVLAQISAEYSFQTIAGCSYNN